MTAIMAALVGLLLSGCTDPAGDDPEGCSGPDCPLTDPGVRPGPLPPRGSDLSIPEALYPTFQMRGCEAFGIGVELQASELAALLPPAFRPTGFVEDTSGNVVVEALKCAGSLDNDTVFGDLATVQVRVRVQPVDASWTDLSSLNFYLLDVAADNGAWAQALAGVALPHDEATITLERTLLPGGSFEARLEVDAADWEATIVYPKAAWDNGGSLSYTMHLWYGDGPYHRLTHQEQSNSSGLPTQSVFTISGAAGLAQAMPAPAHAYFLGTHYEDKHILLQYDGAWTP